MSSDPAPASSRFGNRDTWLKVVYVLLSIAILICLLFIYYLGMQLRYEYQASGYVARGQYLDAADRYLKAHEEAAWGKDRYLYLTGRYFLAGGDHIRAMDFFVRLNSEYPKSDWVAAAVPFVDNVIDKLDPTRIPLEALKSNTQLGQLRAQLRASYKRVVSALKDNKAGISNQLSIEYEAYKKYDRAYRQQLKEAYKAVASGVHPEKLDNPTSTTSGP